MANQQAFLLPESHLQTEKMLKKNKSIVSASEKLRTSVGSEEPRAPYPVFLLLVGLGSPAPKLLLFFPPQELMTFVVSPNHLILVVKLLKPLQY